MMTAVGEVRCVKQALTYGHTDTQTHGQTQTHTDRQTHTDTHTHTPAIRLPTCATDAHAITAITVGVSQEPLPTGKSNIPTALLAAACDGIVKTPARKTLGLAIAHACAAPLQGPWLGIITGRPADPPQAFETKSVETTVAGAVKVLMQVQVPVVSPRNMGGGG